MTDQQPPTVDGVPPGSDDDAETAFLRELEAMGAGGSCRVDAPAPSPVPVSVRALRTARAGRSVTGSGSIAAQTEAWRSQAQQAALGWDPGVARHAWSNTSIRALREKSNPIARDIDADEASRHSEECPLCQYLISPMTNPAELANVKYEDVTEGLSALLTLCIEAVAREQMIGFICEYYNQKVAAGPRLARTVVRKHLDYIVLPGMARRQSVRRLEEVEAFLTATVASQNSISGAVRPDIKVVSSLAKIISVKESLLRSIEGSIGAAGRRPDAGLGPSATRGTFPSAGGPDSAQFPGYR